MKSFEDLTQIAAELGLSVCWSDLPGTHRGGYSHSEKCIVLNRRLTSAQAVFTLAHELIHAMLEHDGPQAEQVEKMVDRRAAAMIITESEYAKAERLCGPDPRIIARELDTLPRAVMAFQAHLAQAAGQIVQ